MFLEKILGNNGNVPEPRVAPAASGTYREGDPLTISSNAYTLATGNVTVYAIAMEDKTLTAAGTLKVAEIDENFIFRTTLSAYSSSTVKFAAKLQLGSTGHIGEVTATAAGLSWTVASSAATPSGGGGAEIYDLLGAAAQGDEVLVRFRQPM